MWVKGKSTPKYRQIGNHLWEKIRLIITSKSFVVKNDDAPKALLSFTVRMLLPSLRREGLGVGLVGEFLSPF